MVSKARGSKTNVRFSSAPSAVNFYMQDAEDLCRVEVELLDIFHDVSLQYKNLKAIHHQYGIALNPSIDVRIEAQAVARANPKRLLAKPGKPA